MTIKTATPAGIRSQIDKLGRRFCFLSGLLFEPQIYGATHNRIIADRIGIALGAKKQDR